MNKQNYRILVVSDSHGETGIIRRILQNEKPFDAIFHCGDVCDDLEGELDISIPVYAVAGNCDRSGRYPSEQIVEIGGYRFFLTHGHRYSVDWRSDLILYAGMEQYADVVCFGHTHVPGYEFDEGLMLLNPGSVARLRQASRIPTYAVLTISDGQFPEVEMKTVPLS